MKEVYFDQTDVIIHETLHKYAGVPIRVLEQHGKLRHKDNAQGKTY